MYIVFVVIIVLASVFLTIAVLLQNSKGGGLAANFGAGNTTFGVRQTADFLEKATWTLAAIIIICCILATATISGRGKDSKSNLTKTIQDKGQTNQQPAFPIENAVENQETPAQE